MEEVIISFLKPKLFHQKSFGNNAVVKNYKNRFVLQSYETNVLYVDKDENKITCLKYDKHTRTTDKHIKEFLNLFVDEGQLEDIYRQVRQAKDFKIIEY